MARDAGGDDPCAEHTRSSARRASPAHPEDAGRRPSLRAGAPLAARDAARYGARMAQEYVLPAGAGIGHVHLKVSDLEGAIAFYRDVLGFELTARFGDESAFLSAGGYHHHVGLNTWDSKGGSRPPKHATGLHHVAIRYPDRASLGRALKRVLDRGVRLHGASDHGVCISLYLADPDGNGLELTADTPRESWRRHADGGLQMVTEPLDLRALLEEALSGAPGTPDGESHA